MTARSGPRLPDVDDVLPDPDAVLMQLGYDSYQAGVILGVIPKGTPRTSKESQDGQRQIRRMVRSGRLKGRFMGREWRFFTPHLRELMYGHDDPSAAQVDPERVAS